MKITTILIAVILSSVSVSSQIRLHQGDFNSAIEKAKAQNKAVCILMIPSEKAPIPKGFINFRKDKKITDILNENFINYYPSAKDTAWITFIGRFAGKCCPGLLFTDDSGEAFYRFFPDFKDRESIIRNLNLALQSSQSSSSLSKYAEQYKKGDRDTSFLKRYINERQKLGIHFNHKLVAEYAEQLPLKSINTVPVSAFILYGGLLYKSPLYNLVYSKRNIADSAWASFPTGARSEINRNIILNTSREAILRKDRELAQRAADYQRSIWTGSYKYGQYISNREMLKYYTAVKDSISALGILSYFIEQNFSSVNADSISKYKAEYPELVKELRSGDLDKPALYDAKAAKIYGRRAEAWLMLQAPVELNNAAWRVYSWSKDKNMLAKALLWSQQSIELAPKPEYYDTLAHLLYRLKFYNEAESMQLRAVELAPRSSTSFQKELTKIKKRQL